LLAAIAKAGFLRPDILPVGLDAGTSETHRIPQPASPAMLS